MSNKNLFNNSKNVNNLASDMVKNAAGGNAYKLSNRGALAQLAATGCFSNTFYTTAEQQLKTVQDLCQAVAAEQGGLEFIAKLAVFSRQSAYMKDMPAYLLSFLSVHSPALYERIFDKVVDNGKMLRNHVQMVRSGAIDGRKSLPRAMRRQIRAWFKNAKNEQLFRDSVGNDPSLSDVIKMVHPRPRDAEQEATFAYVMGKSPINGQLFQSNESNLPQLVKDYESYKANRLLADGRGEVPSVPFQMLDSLGLDTAGWTEVAKNAKWQMTRMNLNTFKRHGVLENKEMVKMIANRLSSKKDVVAARAFPYQLMSAYMAATDVPREIQDALNQAMEFSVENVPSFDGRVFVFVDVSGSMGSPVTGYTGNTRASSMTCVQAASLIASAIARKNPQAVVYPFDTKLHKDFKIKSSETVLETAQRLARFGGGGTDCSLGTAFLNQSNAEVDLVIYISDNESWAGQSNEYRGTGMMSNWEQIKKRCPNAKMVCIDLVPNTYSQAKEREDILNVGGFSDTVWDIVCHFNAYGNDAKHWVEQIDSIPL